MIMGTPWEVAILAAPSLVIMPPVPCRLPAPPAAASISGVMCSTTLMSLASGWVWGSAVYRPLMSDRRISRSACTLTATMADRVSLSPTLISAVLTVSFSLMMGTAPSSSRRSSVRSMLWRRSGSFTSSAVRRICATVWL